MCIAIKATRIFSKTSTASFLCIAVNKGISYFDLEQAKLNLLFVELQGGVDWWRFIYFIIDNVKHI